MTPKEKAEKLFDKYYLICQDFTEEIQCSIQAKQCALIAVNEIFKEHYPQDAKRCEYWNKVKKQIQKL